MSDEGPLSTQASDVQLIGYIFSDIRYSINGEEKGAKGEKALKVLDSLSRLYQTEKNEPLEFEIRLRTSSKSFKDSMHFTAETFTSTLVGLWKVRMPDTATTVERSFIRRKTTDINTTIRRRDPVKLSDEGEIVPDGESVIESKYRKFIIDSRVDNVFKIYGYSPRLVVSSELDIDLGTSSNLDITFDTLISSIRISFLLNANWRLDASIRYQHIIQDKKTLSRELKSFLWNDILGAITTTESFIKMLEDKPGLLLGMGATDYEIELEYLPAPGNKAPLLTDLNHILSVIIQNGYKKTSALSSIKQMAQSKNVSALWAVIKPVLEKTAFTTYKSINSRYHQGVLLFRYMIANPKTGSLNNLSRIYNELGKNAYKITRKLDGERAIVVIESEREATKGSIKVTSYGTDFSFTSGEVTSGTISILDTELYKGTYYVFDVLQMNGEIVAGYTLDQRLKTLDSPFFKNAVAPKSNLPLAVKQHVDLTIDNFSEEFLKVFQTEDKKLSYDGVILTPKYEPYYGADVYKFKPPKENTIDFLLKSIPVDYLSGMGINPKGTEKAYIAYVSNTAQQASVSHRHIVRTNPWWNEHFPTVSKSSIKSSNMLPVPFSTAVCPTSHLVLLDKVPEKDYDDMIVECSWEINKAGSPITGRWVPYRIREDKTTEYKTGVGAYGNFYRVALESLSILYYPLTEEILKKPQESLKVSYFEELTPTEKAPYDLHLTYNRVAKSVIYETLISPLITEATLLEFGGGRGGDMLRAFFAGARNVFAIDSDLNALLTYETRMYEWLVRGKYGGTDSIVNPLGKVPITVPNPMIYNLRTIHHAIGIDPNEPLLNSILVDNAYPRNNVGAISMQFAIHYLCEKEEHIVRLKELCDRLLIKGGGFVFTYLDGKKVFEKLRHPTDKKGIYSVDDMGKITYFHDVGAGTAFKGKPRYMIKAKYPLTAKKLDNFGMRIGMYLPTIRREMFDEFLVNETAIRRVFGSNYKFETYDLMTLDGVAKAFATITKRPIMTNYELLNDADADYNSLTKVAILTKKR